jgi:hypothetical protein
MTSKKEYNKAYYALNRERIMKQIEDNRKARINTDKYIEKKREALINGSNEGNNKFIHIKTMLKYKININPETLKYYYDESLNI